MYNIAQSIYTIAKTEVEDLTKLGVLIKNVPTPWAVPCLFQAKKDGRVRFITELRKLNEQLEKNPHPLPNIRLKTAFCVPCAWNCVLHITTDSYRVFSHQCAYLEITVENCSRIMLKTKAHFLSIILSLRCVITPFLLQPSQ